MPEPIENQEATPDPIVKPPVKKIKSSSDLVNQDADNAAAIKRLEDKLEKQTNEIRDAIAQLRTPTNVPGAPKENLSFVGHLKQVGKSIGILSEEA